MNCRRGRVLLPLLALAALGGVSGCTFINNVIGSEKRQVYKFDHPFDAESTEFRRSTEALGNPMVEGNDARLLLNGDQIFPAMIRDIREAKKTVNLETYIFQPDEAGQQFVDAMIAAARRGVQVRFLIDAQGGKLKQMKQTLEAA